MDRVTAGTQNNRAERRDDGLRQDRHPNRTRGMHITYILHIHELS